ncbi:GNAT family N-acetyltransferase [Jeotgalibaca sp. A127]|uniref:GNAT family N-acetyltransferase n=1 Tax=Jeotgalibaca sp. A127 TaxID=3457324 RepID=UPI003FD3308A
MDNKSYECNYLEWDTNYFGIECGRVNLFGATSNEDQQKISDFLNEFKFVTISNYGNRKENNIWIANKTNAFLADVNIQFEKKLNNNSNFKDENTYVTNNLHKNDQIINIANKSFQHSRFFNDPNLPIKESERIYVHWTENAFEKENKYFVISKKEENVLGYLLFSITNKNNAVIELIAVDSSFQGHGIGGKLMKTLETFLSQKKITSLKVGTQVNNISANQFYTAMGFKYVSCGSIYHLWR